MNVSTRVRLAAAWMVLSYWMSETFEAFPEPSDVMGGVSRVFAGIGTGYLAQDPNGTFLLEALWDFVQEGE